jgi:penicillin amidase
MAAVTGIVAALVVGNVGCSQNNPGPALTITPSGQGGAVTVSGPTEFTAVLVNSTDAVAWTVSGGGTLSSTAGLHVTYVPPAGAATAMLTAAAAGIKASVSITAGPAPIDVPGLSAAVTVQYDAQDIPHIQCAQIRDCISVQGYLHARDRLFPMDFLRHVGRGRVSELIGVDGLAQDEQLRTLFTTRGGNRLEDELVAALDPVSAGLIAAYTAGVNAYLAQLRATHAALPGEYDQLPFRITADDLPDWTPQDSLAVARLEAFQLSETIEGETANGHAAQVWGPGPPVSPLADPGKLNAWIRAASPPTERAHTLAVDAPAPAVKTAAIRRPARSQARWQSALAALAIKAHELREQLRPAGVAVGSNNWVVSAAKSATGVAMVANDPHLSLQYPPLFHLAVMTSSNPADNLNLAGGAFPGIPGALVGRGAHVGWGVTVVGYDVTDLYLETFLPQNMCPTPAPCVLFKGVPTSTLPAPQTYLVRTGPGAAGLVDSTKLPLENPPHPVVLVVPHHGPVVQAPDPTTGSGVSVRWTGQEGNTQDVKAILGLNTATDIHSAVEALKGFATGAQNFVLADDQGNIAYDPHALVPVRDFADVRKTAPKKLIPPWFPLPGDGSAEWGGSAADCANPAGAPAACWIPDDQLPYGENPAKGYFFTANADPTADGVTDGNSPLAHPPYLSFSWDDSSGFRATRIDQMLKAAIAAHGTVSLADMQAIQSDHVSRPGMVFTAYIAQLAADKSSAPEFAAARGVLAQWAANGWDCPSGLTGSDPRASAADANPVVVQNSAGCFLFHAFLRTLLNNVFADDLALAHQTMDGLAAIKAMIYMLAPDVPTDASFCNDVSPTGDVTKSGCDDQVVAALIQAYDQIAGLIGADPHNWVWGRVHTMQPVSLLALVTTNYAPGPYARPGGAFTVDVGSPDLAAGGLSFPYHSGGNVRHISLMDPAKPVIKMQLPGPERDGSTVLAGPDLLGQWVNNQYFDFAFGDQINSVAVSSQTFKAP